MELRDRRMMLIDCETTGKYYFKNQILDLAILCIEQGEVIGELEIQIKHKEYLIDPEAMAINGINLIEHEATAVTTDIAVDQIIEFFEEYKQDDYPIMVGQNVKFDIEFLKKLFESEYELENFKELIGYKQLDIMQLALIKNIEGKLKLESQSLDSILKALNIPITEGRHTAYIDCYLEYEVLKRLMF